MQIVAYLRVSTAKQGISGLGLEAQRAAVMSYAAAGGHRLVAEFVEIESGKKADRPELTTALTACRLHRATLVIAKLDRLARNVAFIANLMDGGVDFVACDMPHANRLTLHLLAAIAEHEREMISQRTKAALAAAKARGVKLGNPNGAAGLKPHIMLAVARSIKVRREKADRHATAVKDIIHRLHDDGMSLRASAAELNRLQIPSPRGKLWNGQQVRRTLARVRGD
jgi:DNA invertase Pin-like site-specific DNA recombinase